MKGMIYCPHRTDLPVNLMGNSWFIPRYLVNQRGQASYTTSWGRTIDRWYLSGSASNPATMTLTEDGIQISCESSFLQQRILNPDVTKPHTAGFCIDGDIVCMHYSPAYVQNEVRLYGFFPITLNNIPNGATIRWAALYEGTYTRDNFPPPTPCPYSVELAECQRYYQPPYTRMVQAYYDGFAPVIPLFAVMRATPTIADISVKDIGGAEMAASISWGTTPYACGVIGVPDAVAGQWLYVSFAASAEP